MLVVSREPVSFSTGFLGADLGALYMSRLFLEGAVVRKSVLPRLSLVIE